MFATLMLILYGFGVADQFFSESTSLESGKIYSVIGKVSKTIESENSTQLYIECAKVTDESGRSTRTGIVCHTQDNGYIKGDEVTFSSTLNRISTPDNPGEFNASQYYAGFNIFYQGYPKQVEITRKCENLWIRGIFLLKEKLKDTYLQIGDEKEAGVCISIVLGEKTRLENQLKKLFQENGISHILAISGLHISMIGMCIYRMMRKIGIRFEICATVSSFVMISYGIMTGNSVSTIRALVMFILSIYAEVFGRTYDNISAMCLSAIIIFLKFPYSIYNSGMYLSFAAVSAIVLVNPTILRIFEIRNVLVKSFLFSLSITITTLPILAISYYEIPTYSVFLNMIIVPCMGMLMASALLAGSVGIFSKTLGNFFLGPAGILIHFFEKICMFVENLPNNNYIIGAPALWQVAAFELLVWGSVWLYSKKKWKTKWIFAGVIVSGICILLWRPQAEFEMTMLSVGQGDCMYISSQGKVLLIDGGSSNEKNVGKNTIIPFLKYKGVRKVDYVILTHADYDHYSGLLEVLESNDFTIDCFVMPKRMIVDENDTQLWETGKQNATAARKIAMGEYLIREEFSMLCIHPQSEKRYDTTNASSLAFWIQYQNLDIITTGDMEQEGELEVMEHIPLTSVEILKCGHHGSSTSNGKAWINTLKPQIALISCGKNNSYGHPHRETIENLQMVNSNVMRTDCSGAISIWVKNGRIYAKGYCN